jgi:hypothetical protein
MLVENVENVVYGEQQLRIKFSAIFVILALNVILARILIDVHNKQVQNIFTLDSFF